MVDTPNVQMTLIEQSQAQKEVTVNNALRLIDVFLNSSIKDKDLTTPPGSPIEGDTYIVAGSPTGAWVGQAGKIAWFVGGAWKFIVPKEGCSFWVADENTVYYYNGSNWSAAAGAVQNLPLLGVNTTADVTNKLAVNSAAVLFNNVGAGIQQKLNKNAVGDTASVLYQSSFSGVAEVGLLGNNNYTFKVSSNNFATSFNALTLDSTTGLVTFGEGSNIPTHIGYVLNRYYGGFGVSHTVAPSSQSVAADVILSTLFQCSVKTTFNRIGVNIQTVGVGGSLIRLGVYSVVDGVPTDRVADLGTVVADVLGDKEITIAGGLTLAPGWYSLVALPSAACSILAYAASSIINRIYGSTDSLSSPSARIRRNFAFAALPTTFGTPVFDNNTVPHIWLRRV